MDRSGLVTPKLDEGGLVSPSCRAKAASAAVEVLRRRKRLGNYSGRRRLAACRCLIKSKSVGRDSVRAVTRSRWGSTGTVHTSVRYKCQFSLLKLSFFVLARIMSTWCRAPPALSTHKSAFAAASISMQQFHQTRFIRKTFCQRLIERCQTASMLPGLCQTFPCPSGFFDYGEKGLCPLNTEMDADEEFLFRICDSRRDLRASPDSVAAGRAVLQSVRITHIREDFFAQRNTRKQYQQLIYLCALCVFLAKKSSRKNIVKKKRRKSQTSQDKAVATNYHSHQTSGKNQNREYFTVFFGRVF